MARIRTIKPEFCQSESLGRISRDARLTFILLWTQCDDHGRCRAHPRALANILYPFDDDAQNNLGVWLEELATEKCLTLYKVGGNHYLQINNWSHQRIDKPGKPQFPAPEDGQVVKGFPRTFARVPRALDEPSRSIPSRSLSGKGVYQGSGIKDQGIVAVSKGNETQLPREEQTDGLGLPPKGSQDAKQQEPQPEEYSGPAEPRVGAPPGPPPNWSGNGHGDGDKAESTNRLIALCRALHVDPATSPGIIARWIGQIAAFEAEGIDFERHLLKAAEEAGKRGNQQKIHSLNYLANRARELRLAEDAATESGDIPAKGNGRYTIEEQRKHIKDWLENYGDSGKWVPAKIDFYELGPAPHEEGTKISREMLEKYPKALAMRERITSGEFTPERIPIDEWWPGLAEGGVAP